MRIDRKATSLDPSGTSSHPQLHYRVPLIDSDNCKPSTSSNNHGRQRVTSTRSESRRYPLLSRRRINHSRSMHHCSSMPVAHQVLLNTTPDRNTDTIHLYKHHALLLVESPTKVKVQLQNASIKCTPEPPPMAVFPRMTNDTERDIFVWWPGSEYDQLGIVVPWYSFDMICRRFRLVTRLSA
jgi:hypothetical protein